MQTAIKSIYSHNFRKYQIGTNILLITKNFRINNILSKKNSAIF